jgi:membrane fusion protein, multidrug efflux system
MSAPQEAGTDGNQNSAAPQDSPPRASSPQDSPPQDSRNSKATAASARDPLIPLQATPTHGGEIRDEQLANGQHHGGHGQDDHSDGNGGHAHGDEENVIPNDLPRPSGKVLFVLASAFVLLLISLFLVGLIPGLINAHRTDQEAAARANDAPIVSTTQPVATPTSKDVILPADIRAYSSTMLYPRANGYLKKWYYDIQSRVKEGDVLADISTPDIDAELAQSQATLKQDQAAVDTAQANLVLTKQTLDQYVQARKDSPGSVTVEDFNTRVSNYDQAVAAKKQAEANVGAAQANVQQMQVMVSFEKIIAPFDGVITFRGYDNGALVNPSMTGPNQEMFQIQQTDPLRVFVSVPQVYSSQMTIGQPTYLKVRNYGEREFKGYVARSTAAIDPSTRTMQFELDFPNKDNALYPGMYGQARLPIAQTDPVLTIPSSSLVFNADGTQVAIVRDGKAHFQKVSVARDLGTQLEVVDGLSQDDQVVTNPGERLTDGVEVQVAGKPGQEQQRPQGEKVAEKN